MLHPVSGRETKSGEYVLPKCGKKFTSAELVDHWKNLIEKYPISLLRMVLMRKTGKAGRS